MRPEHITPAPEGACPHCDGIVTHVGACPVDPLDSWRTVTVDLHRLNEARWAACNARYVWAEGVTMEQAAAVADEIVREYLGMAPEDWTRELES